MQLYSVQNLQQYVEAAYAATPSRGKTGSILRFEMSARMRRCAVPHLYIPPPTTRRESAAAVFLWRHVRPPPSRSDRPASTAVTVQPGPIERSASQGESQRAAPFRHGHAVVSRKTRILAARAREHRAKKTAKRPRSIE